MTDRQLVALNLTPNQICVYLRESAAPSLTLKPGAFAYRRKLDDCIQSAAEPAGEMEHAQKVEVGSAERIIFRITARSTAVIVARAGASFIVVAEGIAFARGVQSITFDDAFNLLTCLANPSIDIATIWNANMNSFAAGIIGRKGNIAAQLKRAGAGAGAGAGTGTGAENLLHGDGPASSDARPLALAAHAEAPNSEGAAGRSWARRGRHAVAASPGRLCGL